MAYTRSVNVTFELALECEHKKFIQKSTLNFLGAEAWVAQWEKLTPKLASGDYFDEGAINFQSLHLLSNQCKITLEIIASGISSLHSHSEEK